jgi:hypothetical protein
MARSTMSPQSTMTLMAVVEFALWTAFGLLFWTRKLHHRFPAMGIYLALHIASTPVLFWLLYGKPPHWFTLYYYVYWAVYFASAMTLFFVCVEVFRSALSVFPGLQRLGTVAFRWVALVSVIVSLSTLTFDPSHILTLNDVAYKLMRSVSIVELCLLAFLCLSMNALQLSVRDMAFGIALGFGLMATNDLVVDSLLARNHSLTEPLQFVFESLILATLGTWVVYTALPEPVRKPVMMPVNSTILRWNEIASALGHTGTQVAVQQAASGFFLTDAEQVVEEAMSRNLKSRESEA